MKMQLYPMQKLLIRLGSLPPQMANALDFFMQLDNWASRPPTDYPKIHYLFGGSLKLQQC